MSLAELDGSLLAGAIWVLAAAATLAVLPLPPRAPWRASLLPRLARLLAVLASLALVAVGVLGLACIVPAPIEWWPGLPGDPFRIASDALASPFLLLLGVLGAASLWCADIPATPTAGSRIRLALMSALVMALATVYAAQHVLLLLLAWEGVTLLSAALVASTLASARARYASFLFLALSHVGTACIAIGLFPLVNLAGSFAFGDLTEMLVRLPPGSADGAVWLASIGFAVKLGLVPFHAWLPHAHGEAPGPASSLLSGAVVPAGLYGLLRFAWQVPGLPPAGLGEALMLTGLVTAVLGALRAAFETDIKRLLACSTIKHSGVIAIALGLAAIFARNGRVELAGLTLAAALYHALGHGLAKGLGFLAVAEAAHAAGSRSLERLGGLARRMPLTSVAALVATLALCGLPLLACFAGEWMVFQAMIRGYAAGQSVLRFLVPPAGAALALATAVASVAMVKLYGLGFLGRPRSDAAAVAPPAPRGFDLALLALAALVIAWGVAAPQALIALGAPLAALLGAGFDARSLTGFGGFTLDVPPGGFASVSPIALLVLLALFALLAIAWGTARGLRHSLRRAPSWSGGMPLGPRHQISAAAFARPLLRVVLRAGGDERSEIAPVGATPHGAPMRPAFAERLIYHPLARAVLWTSEHAGRLQGGPLHVSIACLLITLVALLLFARH